MAEGAELVAQDPLGLDGYAALYTPDADLSRLALPCLLAGLPKCDQRLPTYLDDLVSFVSDNELEQLLDAAQKQLRQNADHQGAQDILTHLSFQMATLSQHSPLYSKECHHLIFPPTYLEQALPLHLERRHPTWNLKPEHQLDFGGPGYHECNCCGQTGHRWFTLPTGILLETCHSCLGWSVECLYYSHDPNGSPQPLPTEKIEPDFPTEPFRPCRVGLATTPSRWRRQDHALSNNRQNLHRCGGCPSWVQGEDFPDCPKCDKVMPFVAQLDSEIPTEGGVELVFGDGGLCLAFFCKECKISAFKWQGY